MTTRWEGQADTLWRHFMDPKTERAAQAPLAGATPAGPPVDYTGIAGAARRGVDQFFASDKFARMLRDAVTKIVEEDIRWKVWARIQPAKSSTDAT
jgi:hypothetical protein